MMVLAVPLDDGGKEGDECRSVINVSGGYGEACHGGCGNGHGHDKAKS